ncbi:MAG: hypothetical protein ACR2L3_01165 [Actinomycetota bacterium]
MALVPMPQAHAGGWWSGVDYARHVGVGETTTARAEVLFRTMKLAEVAQETPYFAYLVRGVDITVLDKAMSRPEPKDWWTPPKQSILIGDVELGQRSSNLVIATARVTIPEMPSGRYDLMLCDEGCRTPLGNIVPTRVRVSGDASLARTARRLEEANGRLRVTLAGVRRDLRQTEKLAGGRQAAFRESAEAIAGLETAIGDLQGEIAAQQDSAAPARWPYALWLLAGVGIALAGSRLRHPRIRPLPETPEWVPDDALELSSSTKR